MTKKNFNLDFEWDKKVDFKIDDISITLPEDKLNRQSYAEYLYHFLVEQGKDDNKVINLNAEWGSGKTFFMRRLYISMKEKHPCIYIDSWKQDYSDDAFITLFSSLSSQIKKYSKGIDQSVIAIGDSIARFTKQLAPALISSLVKHYTGLDNLDNLAKDAAKLLLEEHEKRSEALKKLKEELTFWTEQSVTKGYTLPVFIFIDELDRCRPNYAISLLEVVKHIFDIDNFSFVIATDTNQLQHSIKNIYGNDFAANDYLSRFFHRRFTLKAPNIHTLVLEKFNERDPEKILTLCDKFYPHPSHIEQMAFNISSIFQNLELNIRDVLRNVDRLIDLILYNSFKKKIDYLALTILMVVYEKDYAIISNLLGKKQLGKRVEEVMNEHLNGFGNKELEIILDSSPQNSKIVEFIRNNGMNNFSANLEMSTIKIRGGDYISDFIMKTNDACLISNESKANAIRNYMTVSTQITDKEILNFHFASIIKADFDTKFYHIASYIDFIEMANSFE